jgi:hypothetical protein
MLLFVITLGTNLLGRLSFGAAAPLMASAPMTNEGYGIGGGPIATQPPVTDNTQVIPTAETLVMTAPGATPSGETRLVPPAVPPDTKAAREPVNIWLFIWLGLAVVFLATATLIHRTSIQVFRRKVGEKRNK